MCHIVKISEEDVRSLWSDLQPPSPAPEKAPTYPIAANCRDLTPLNTAWGQSE